MTAASVSSPFAIVSNTSSVTIFLDLLVRHGTEQVRGRSGGGRLIDLFSNAAEGELGRALRHFSAGEKLSSVHLLVPVARGSCQISACRSCRKIEDLIVNLGLNGRVQLSSLFAMKSFQNESGQEDIDDYSPLWKFVTKVEKAGGGNVTWSCNIYTKAYKGSYSRVKAHLLKQKGAGIAGCAAVTMDQMKRMQQLMDDEELRKKNSKPKEVSLPSSSASSNMASKSSFSGPMQNDDPTLTKKRKRQLGPLEKAFNLNARDELHSEIARLFYTGGLSFNIARNPHYVRAFSLATQRTISVVTDNAPVCKAAGLLVEAKYPHIFWTPCVVHTLNLALKNICAPTDSLQNKEVFDEYKWIAEVANDASMIKNFILNHNMRLSMFNDNSNLKMLSLADTRFASTIIMLKRFRQIKKCLENMVISERWDVYNEDDVVKARVVKYKILDDQFWEKIDYILAFTSPIYEMLRKADTDQPCVHLVSEWWDEMINKLRVSISKGAHSEDSKFYEVVHNILVKQWNKSNTPLHCLAHSLNPRYYSHEWLQESPNRLPPHRVIEVSRERKKCIERYYSNSSERRSVNEEFASFSKAIDDFSDNDAMCDQGLMSPTKWRSSHYSEGEGKMWDVGANGFDSMDMEGAAILEIVNLFLDEPKLESVLFTDEGGVGDETDMNV
ncbi:hypothetical protein ZIOFF_013685 [Zingiber officinale]|uniref:DUF659 domain-containing protein n=1 Tax=Zingiber officinale TaxID=94328 RepID=A0A8J5LD05_ZINOF|nr:hypothetical protein ZIOFF_013685 [Zingiber officinale]